MDDFDSHMDRFFHAATEALKMENDFLEKHFSSCERNLGFYKDTHHGISILSERTMVYFVFRELLRTEFPYEVEWEKPYPNSSAIADLVLTQDEDEKAYIECEIGTIEHWKKQKAKDIKTDLTKLNVLPQEIRGFVFAVWFGKEDGLENLNWLRRECNLPQNKPDHYDSFGTLLGRKDGQLDHSQVNLALLEAK
jgi:hypothetical protein